MAYRLVSHHSMRFNPRYIGGSVSTVRRNLQRTLAFDVNTPQEFEDEILKSKVPVVVDFHASWCGPCKTLTPILTNVMDTYDGKVNFAKVDVDELQDLAMEYGVMSVPTVLAIKDGTIADQFVGVKSKDELHSFVEKLLE